MTFTAVLRILRLSLSSTITPPPTPDKLAYPEFAQATLGLCAAFIDIAQKGLD